MEVTREKVIKIIEELDELLLKKDMLVATTKLEIIKEYIHQVKKGLPIEESEKLVLEHIKLPLTIDPMSRFMFDGNMNMIAETRGWGWIQYLKDAELIQDTLGLMIIKAFNKVYGQKGE